MAAQHPFTAAAGLIGVPSAVAAARDAVDVVVRERGLRRVGPELVSESLRAGAQASAGLAAAEDAAGDPDPDAVVTGALRASVEIVEAGRRFTVAPLQTLARLHTLVAAGWCAEADLGRIAPQAWDRLQGLARAVGTAADASVPVPVVAALVHAEVASCAGFSTGNGLVARAAERALLSSRGFDPLSLTVPEQGHAEYEAEYRSCLAAYARGGAGNVGGWLQYACRAYARGAERSPAGPARRTGRE